MKNGDKKALGYVRVSSKGQEKEGTSLSGQRKSIRAYSQSRGINLVDIFEDVASGKDFINRPGFQVLQQRLEENNFDAVVVHKYDRLSRSPVDGRVFTDELLKKGKSLISVEDNIDTSSPMGRAMFTMMLTFAEMEREIIKERMAAGREARIEQGRKPSSYNYGFVRNEQRDLVPVPEEIDVVKKIFYYYREFESIGQVVKTLNSQQMIAKYGGQWTVKSVWNCLTNPIYTGKIRWKGQLIKGTHNPVISTRSFNKAGAVLRGNNKKNALQQLKEKYL